MSNREEAIEDGANALRDLLSALDMLGQCEGNKAKLELAEIAVERFLILQELCDAHSFTIAVGIDVASDDLIHA
jgi:hypothetical protein